MAILVTIRLARHGGKKNPFYHVTVAEKSARRDGRFIERLGFYNPIARGGEEELRIDLDRVDYWLANGAQATDRVRQLVYRSRNAHLEELAGDETAIVDGATAGDEAGAAEEAPAAGEVAEAAAADEAATADEALVADEAAAADEAPAADEPSATGPSPDPE